MEVITPEKSSLLVEEAEITAVLEFAKDQLLIAVSGWKMLIVCDWNSIRFVEE